MKLGILGTRGIPARYGGFETFAEQLSTRLVERGHQVTVFCEAGSDNPNEFKGVTLRHLKAPRVGRLSTILYDAACLWQARSGFDVVYMLGYGTSALCWLPRLSGTRVWINMDGLEWTRAKWNGIARAYLRCAEAIAMHTPDRIIADAAAIKTNFQSRYRRLPPCDVIPYGCEIVTAADPGPLGQFGVEPGGYDLVVCRFEPENHVNEIVQGFLAAHSHCRLVLVGDHTVKNAYVDALRREKSDRILFVGPIYDQEKLQALRFHCRAYLHGHSVGGTNPTLLEAMGCGNAVVAHDNPFNREVLGDAGMFFQTPQQLSAAIQAIDSGQAQLPVLKARAAERVKQFYTWERITDFYCELLTSAGSTVRKYSEDIQCAPLRPATQLPEERVK